VIFFAIERDGQDGDRPTRRWKISRLWPQRPTLVAHIITSTLDKWIRPDSLLAFSHLKHTDIHVRSATYIASQSHRPSASPYSISRSLHSLNENMDIPPSFGNAIYPVSYFLGYRKSHPKDEQDPLLVAKGLRSGGLMRKVEYWAHTLVAAYVGLILVGECESLRLFSRCSCLFSRISSSRTNGRMRPS
jgi:hypothetical protein